MAEPTLAMLPADPHPVAERIAAAGIDGPIQRVIRLDFDKRAVHLGDGGGFVKLAFSPYAVALARREAAAYAGPPPCTRFRLPEFRRFHDAGAWTALHLSFEEGHPLGSAHALIPRKGPFEAAGARKLLLSALDLDDAGDGPGDGPEEAATFPPTRFADRRKRLLERSGDRLISFGPSHGDFVHWNILHHDRHAPLLIDFEHHAASAPRSHDRLHWIAGPLLRRVTRRDRSGLSAGVLVAVAAALIRWFPREEVSLFLLRHGRRLEREQAATETLATETPGAETLGADHSGAYRHRARLLDLYDRLLAELLK